MENNIFPCGSNNNGQLGIGYKGGKILELTQISNIKGRKIAAGQNSTAVITTI